MDLACFCLSVILSIKHDSVCQVVFDKLGRDSAPSQCSSIYIKTLIGIEGAGGKIKEPSGVPPDTGAERNKGLLNFGRENILLQAQESPPGGGKMFWECLGTPADFQAQPTQKREIHSAEEHELHIPEEGRRSSRRGSTRKSAACPVQRPKTA
ncbi:unnamed protein product [Pleuronectes platessa]|uniref:Uncharacterized protein n=1 Tax=Pleuronectes platessa TaxID=8262 RepID=A0A9N7VAQ7_PLEPL|nr:unnamed protein product [Pleuronectes platessa]